MSKMSELHRELTERAYDLGYESLEDAQANGYDIDYDNQTLVDVRDKLHQEHLEKKASVLPKLKELQHNLIEAREPQWSAIITDTIQLLEEGEL